MNRLTKLSMACLSAATLCACSNQAPTDSSVPTLAPVETGTPIETGTPEDLTPINEVGVVKEVSEDALHVELYNQEFSQEVVIHVENLSPEDQELCATLQTDDVISVTYSGAMSMSLPAQLMGEVDISASEMTLDDVLSLYAVAETPTPDMNAEVNNVEAESADTEDSVEIEDENSEVEMTTSPLQIK